MEACWTHPGAAHVLTTSDDLEIAHIALLPNGPFEAHYYGPVDPPRDPKHHKISNYYDDLVAYCNEWAQEDGITVVTGRGGARPGAGRPRRNPEAPRVHVTVRLDPAAHAWITAYATPGESLGGAIDRLVAEKMARDDTVE